MSRAPSEFSAATVERFVEVLHPPGNVVELRMPRYNHYGQTATGYFDDPRRLAHAAAPWDGQANIFMTLNPVIPALLARAKNRIAERAEHTTSDADVTHRRWLLLDIDPVRAAGISSTAEESDAARTLRQ
jgi:hypothetical protein